MLVVVSSLISLIEAKMENIFYFPIHTNPNNEADETFFFIKMFTWLFIELLLVSLWKMNIYYFHFSYCGNICFDI